MPDRLLRVFLSACVIGLGVAARLYSPEIDPGYCARIVFPEGECTKGGEGSVFVHNQNSVSVSVGAVLKPAGLDNAKGVPSAQLLKGPTDPTWKDDATYKEWSAFMGKYYPDGDKTSINAVLGHVQAQALVQVLKQCGDDLTRENVMKQAASLKNLELGMLLPGIKINTSPKSERLCAG
jgi:hypothetical protein